MSIVTERRLKSPLLTQGVRLLNVGDGMTLFVTSPELQNKGILCLYTIRHSDLKVTKHGSIMPYNEEVLKSKTSGVVEFWLHISVDVHTRKLFISTEVEIRNYLRIYSYRVDARTLTFDITLYHAELKPIYIRSLWPCKDGWIEVTYNTIFRHFYDSSPKKKFAEIKEVNWVCCYDTELASTLHLSAESVTLLPSDQDDVRLLAHAESDKHHDHLVSPITIGSVLIGVDDGNNRPIDLVTHRRVEKLPSSSLPFQGISKLSCWSFLSLICGKVFIHRLVCPVRILLGGLIRNAKHNPIAVMFGKKLFEPKLLSLTALYAGIVSWPSAKQRKRPRVE